MTIYIGADHNGFIMKAKLVDYLHRSGYKVVDNGNDKLNPDDDFPQFAAKVVNAILSSSDPETFGVLLCGSGQGMCMAANRFKGIRASLVWNAQEAHMSRNDNDSNIICLPVRMLKTKELFSIVNTWLNTPFAGATRFRRRIKEIDQLV